MNPLNKNYVSPEGRCDDCGRDGVPVIAVCEPPMHFGQTCCDCASKARILVERMKKALKHIADYGGTQKLYASDIPVFAQRVLAELDEEVRAAAAARGGR